MRWSSCNIFKLLFQWEQISAIEDLCFISISQDGTVQISRKNGIPTYLKFESFQIMQSFISLLDGYYRLMVKWTFNLCKEMLTPTLKRLHELKCHGPVGYVKIRFDLFSDNFIP